jgi:hypothetical protein
VTEKPADGPDKPEPPAHPPLQPIPRIQRRLWPRAAWLLFVSALYLIIGAIVIYFVVLLMRNYVVHLFRGP